MPSKPTKSFSRILQDLVLDVFTPSRGAHVPPSIAGYENLEPLGEGGMGAVYRAWDPELDRHVAIKVLSAMESDERARRRFLREARAMASVEHPNIVHVYGFGQAGEVPYIVMEYVRGDNLAERIDRVGPLGRGDSLRIIDQALEALAEAWEEAGIVHRDIKPSNILLDRKDRVKVCDFGLAKTVKITSHAPTESGVIPGTPHYVSPEQATGRSVDFRSDIYSLGLVLFEALTGRKAFQGGSPAELLAQQLHERVPSLDRAAGAGEAEDLAGLIEWMTRKAPAERPASYDVLQGRVRELLGAGGDAAHRGRRSRRTAAAGAGPARETPSPAGAERRGETPAAAAGEPAVDITPAPAIAVLPFADYSEEGDQAYFCEGIVDELITALSTIEELRVASRTSSFRVAGAHDDPQSIGRALKVSAILRGSLRRSGERLRISVRLINVADGFVVWSQRFDRETRDIFAIQEETARAVVDRLKVQLTQGSASPLIRDRPGDLRAYHLYLKGRYFWNKRTEEGIERSVEHFRRAIEHDPAYGRAHAGLADALTTLGMYGAASPQIVMPEANRVARQALKINSELAEPHASLGCIAAVFDWSWEDAERHFEDAIELDPEYALARHWYALGCLIPQRRFDQALEHIERARQLEPLSPAIHASRGVHAYFAGDYDAAAEALQQTLELDANFAFARSFLGQTHVERGAHDDAARELRKALRLSGEAPEVVAASGYAHAVAGDEEEAYGALESLAELSRQRFVSPSLPARVHAGLGRVEEALDCLARAIDVRASDLAWLGVRPVFACLRGHERFAVMLATMGLGGGSDG